MSGGAGPEVVVVHGEGRRRPVVFFHTWSTEASHKQALGGVLGADQPIYGIEPPHPDDGPLPETAAEWVAFHRKCLEHLPIDPPYRLAGFSFGGVVALEVARELQADRVDVEWLGMIDSLRPKLNPRGARQYVRHHVAELLDLPEDRRAAYLSRLARGGSRRTLMRTKGRVFKVLLRLGLVAERPTSLGDQLEMAPLKKAVWKAYLNYVARPYDWPVALFAGHDNRESASGDPSLRWSRFLRGGFELTPIDGGHFELFSPANVSSVGEAIRASLDRADREVLRRLAPDR